MLKIALIVGAIIVVVAVVFIVVVALQPANFRIARSTTIGASADVVFAQVNDFHKWDAWSPWAKLDTAMKTTFSGPDAGKDASYAWKGNKQVGEGRMTILESKPGELVRIKLEFLKPFQATNTAEFTFKPEGGKTTVTWAMTGTNNFMFKAVNLIMNMDKVLGGQFEQGLAQMKVAAEAAA